MTKGSDSREFFEIFKQTEKAEDTQKMEVKPQDVSSQPPRPSGPESKPVTSPTVSSVDPLEWIKNTRAEEPAFKGKMETPVKSPTVSAPAKAERVPHKDEVTLRQETLIIGAIAATFLSIACFFVGYKVGYNKGAMNQAEEWLETIEPQKAKELAKTLQNSLGYDSFIVNIGKELYICVGEFETNDSAVLIDTQKKLAEFKYENKKQFDSCYPIRMR